MLLFRLPTLATLTTVYLITLTCLCQFVFAQSPSHDSNSSQSNNQTEPAVTCRPFGACEPCKDDALHEPFCQPFGNRRLMHCSNATSSTTPTNPSEPTRPRPNMNSPFRPAADISAEPPLQGENLAWESCGRIVSQERADFWEFVACNVFFAVFFLFILFARSKRLQALQARQLAARIGLIRGGGSAR